MCYGDEDPKCEDSPHKTKHPDHVSTTGLHMCWSVRKGQGKHTRWFILLWVGDIQTFVKLVSQLCPCFAKKKPKSMQVSMV